MTWFIAAIIALAMGAAAFLQRQRRPNALPVLSSDARRRAQGYADYLARTDRRLAALSDNDRLAFVCNQVGCLLGAQRAAGAAAVMSLIGAFALAITLGFACYAAGFADTVFLALALMAAATGAALYFTSSAQHWRRAESEVVSAGLDVDRLLRIAGLPPRHAAPKRKTIATR